MAQGKTVWVAGASGVVGQAAVEHFAREGREVIAVSRRAPDLPSSLAFEHLPLDLRDEAACAAAIEAARAPTHLVYAALHERPDLVQGWRDSEQMNINDRMLRNLLHPLARRGSLRHVTLLQGTKAYGVHLHRIPVPARESWPRDPHENFYWLQEDALRAAAARYGFAFTIFRPQIVFGDALGAAMNITPVLGAYAAICREEGLPFAFTGGPSALLEAVDADLLARAIGWAGEAESARDETFNITNGDVFAWRNVWPAIATALGAEPGADRPMSIAAFLDEKAPVWDRIAARHDLKERSLPALLGQSHHYADWCFAHGVSREPPPVLVSTIKLRQAGFGDCVDTEAMFAAQFERLRTKSILPPKASSRGV